MAKLKAAFALLPDGELQNRVAAAALLVHGASGGRLRWPRLGPHVSLKQPFSVESLPAVERYLAELAAATAPVPARLRGVEVHAQAPDTPETVVWVSVEESPRLRALHQTLNDELGGVVAEPRAAFDGPSYQFHMTLGFLPGPLIALPDALPDFSGPQTFRQLGLFIYEGFPKPGWQCMCFKALPLTGAAG